MASPIGRILLMDKGAYNGTTVYNQLDWVRSNGAAWVCKVDGTVGITPVEGANWTLLAQDGNVSGSVEWSSGVLHKPFENIGTGLSVDGSDNLNLDTTLLTGSNITYDNTGSGASSINVQDALDELFSGGGGGGLSNAFDEIRVGGISLTASGGDTFNLLAGSNITLTPNASTKTVEISSSGGGTGGHTMLPNPASSPAPTEADCISAINTAVAAGPTNDNVASEYTIGKWSNTYEKLAIVKATSSHPIGTSGIGTWQDNIDPSNPPSKADERGWGWIEWSALHGIGSENHDVKLSFDPNKCSTPITLGGYIIDDVNDMMCIKFGNQISSADTETAWVGIKIIVTRTAATEITP